MSNCFCSRTSEGKPIVRKQAKPRPDGTLLTEIAWLEELPPHCRQHFPRVLRSHKKSDGRPVFLRDAVFRAGVGVVV